MQFSALGVISAGLDCNGLRHVIFNFSELTCVAHKFFKYLYSISSPILSHSMELLKNNTVYKMNVNLDRPIFNFYRVLQHVLFLHCLYFINIMSEVFSWI